jgi:hypothetical protein
MTGRMIAGLVALDAFLLAFGLALLFGLGLVRTVREGVRLAGLALFAGWAATGILASTAAVAGLALTVSEIVVLDALVACGAVALALVVPARPGRPWLRAAGAQAWVAAVGAGVLVVYLEALFRRAKLEVSTSWDAWGFWIPKAESIVYHHGLATGLGGFTSFSNPDYPPLAPVLDAVTFRFAGSPDPTVLPLQHWVVAVAFLAALAGLLAPRVSPAILWPALALLALMPDFGTMVGSSLGDEPLALLVGAGGVCGALWLLERDPRYLALCTLFEAAAALTKVEGLPAALLVCAMLAVAAGARRSAPLALAALLVVAALVPWRVWMREHHVVSNSAFPFSRLFDPAFLVDRSSRLGTALASLPGYFLSVNRWLGVVPLVLALALLVARRRRDLAVLAFGTTVLAFLGLAAVYWISPLPVHWYIDTSAARVATSTAVFCAALFPLLLHEALRRDG